MDKVLVMFACVYALLLVPYTYATDAPTGAVVLIFLLITLLLYAVKQVWEIEDSSGLPIEQALMRLHPAFYVGPYITLEMLERMEVKS